MQPLFSNLSVFMWTWENLYTIVGTIIDIENKCGWCYLASDDNCTKKVDQIDTDYWCLKCARRIKFPIYR